jgi:hypothetical protein
MKGGDNTLSNNRLQLFISIIIVGYFGIKIIYGLFFNFYPLKYYNRNINITSNSNNNNIDQDITLNAYVPGLWNNEMTDFITAIVISLIIYIFTNASSKSIYNEYGNLNIAFIIGYIIGLGYPPISATIQTQTINTGSSIGKYILLGFSVIIIIIAIVSNYRDSEKLGNTHKRNYLLYCLVVILLIGGLIITKKTSDNYSSVSYFNSNGESCTFVRNGVVQTSGDILNITAPFVSFIIILLFSYEPNEINFKNVYIMIYGILLGIIISGISYFGIEYFLQKIPERECNSVQECIMKKMPEPVNNTNDDLNNPLLKDTNLNNSNNNNSFFKLLNFNTGTYSGLKIFLFIIIILLITYLIYYFITS